MKTISDIRLYKSSDTVQLTGFENAPLNLAAHRAAMKLREQNFSLGDFDHLYLNFTACRPARTVELIDKVDRYHPWYRYCDVGVSVSELESLEKSDRPELILERIKTVLLSLFCADGSDAETVEKSITEAKKGAAMLMRFKEKKSAKLTAVIYLRLLDSGYYRPLLRVSDHEDNEVFSADLPETLDLSIIGEIQLSSKKVTVKPRKNVFTEGLKPISFDLQ